MWHTPVLGPANGPVPARIMLVGEAPGRLGAGRTGVPFRGDEAGRRFDALLSLAGLARDEVFVTNAVLCNPLSDRGLNRRPRLPEVARCSGFLREQVLTVDPALVVAMGGVALGALGRVAEHGLSLRDGCGRLRPWFGRHLIAVDGPPLHRPPARSHATS
jgi:uracil-DNA glycosylase family 4